MLKLSKEEILKRIKDLPLDLKSAAQSDQTVLELQTIAKNHNLHVDQLGTLADLVELTLGGVVLTREFVTLMREMLPEIDQGKVMAIAEEVNRRVFAPYQESLRKLEAKAIEQGQRESISVGEHEQKTEAPIVQPVPVIAPQMHEQNIEVAKMSALTMSTQQEKDISHENRDPRLKMIPDDVKTRISSDPYKEALE